ncbi:MAG: 2-amino-4-hydroxy-6-hydroxymethyldihydropteridine diphosphokinase [Myxococcales bacterium]|nr:2-amino-4-hydroxy-6-hydroxymethyldihydropteridine diphosphokinase [Myxococcales bacterium]
MPSRPLDLLDALQAIEDRMGRVRSVRWGPRIIDLDVALYSDVVWSDERLVVPHPELANRTFVLRPLADLVPEWIVPGYELSVAELDARCREPEIHVLDDRVVVLTP